MVPFRPVSLRFSQPLSAEAFEAALKHDSLWHMTPLGPMKAQGGLIDLDIAPAPIPIEITATRITALVPVDAPEGAEQRLAAALAGIVPDVTLEVIEDGN